MTVAGVNASIGRARNRSRLAGAHVGQEDEAGRDRVHRHPGARPVADRDGVGRVDLVDVVDPEAVGDRQAGRLAGRAGQRLELGPGEDDHAPGGQDGGGARVTIREPTR